MASQPVAEILFMEQLGEIGQRAEANAEGQRIKAEINPEIPFVYFAVWDPCSFACPP